ncbi:MAG: MdtA/MuxA family multidrug efflux RND transporter periplasmic adaptor subunit [Janthinobacterium lividum]
MDSLRSSETLPVRTRRPRWLWLIPLAVVAGLLAWQKPWSGPARPAPAGAGMGPPAAPQAVGIAVVATGDMPVMLSGLGTVTPLAAVTVRSQLSGYLTAVTFREGQMVEKGDVLAQIDPRLYEAALAQYQGTLQRDQALLRNAQLDLARYQKLNTQDSISRQTVDTAQATVRQYEGTVKADQGQVDTQRANLDYTRITAPVAGRVGLRQVDAGNYVTAGDANGIVVLTQLQPISVVFTLPEDDLRAVMRQLRANATLTVAAFDRADATKLASGTLATVDNQVDVTTGTVKLRAVFDNADQALFPNQFVNTRLLVQTIPGATLLPAAAVQQGVNGPFVYRLQPGDTVSVQKVTLGATDGTSTIALSGVGPGDRVVVDGTDRLKDGAKVTVPPPAAPPATPSAIPSATGP